MGIAELFVIVAGLFSIAGAVFDWDWFMNNRRARIIVDSLGRTGARVFYFVLGVAIVVVGILLSTGVLS